MSLTVVIYLPDGCGQQFSIPNGKVTTASQYLQLMIATLKLPDLSKKCFALWLKSPLLGTVNLNYILISTFCYKLLQKSKSVLFLGCITIHLFQECRQIFSSLWNPACFPCKQW